MQTRQTVLPSKHHLQHFLNFWSTALQAHFKAIADSIREDMALSQDSSLEEILWRSPPHVQMMGGFLHSNNSTNQPTSNILLK